MCSFSILCTLSLKENRRIQGLICPKVSVFTVNRVSWTVLPMCLCINCINIYKSSAYIKSIVCLLRTHEMLYNTIRNGLTTQPKHIDCLNIKKMFCCCVWVLYLHYVHYHRTNEATTIIPHKIPPFIRQHLRLKTPEKMSTTIPQCFAIIILIWPSVVLYFLQLTLRQADDGKHNEQRI